MKNPRSQLDILNQNFHFHKIPMWFIYMIKFKQHWFKSFLDWLPIVAPPLSNYLKSHYPILFFCNSFHSLMCSYLYAYLCIVLFLPIRMQHELSDSRKPLFSSCHFLHVWDIIGAPYTFAEYAILRAELTGNKGSTMLNIMEILECI